MENIIDVDYMQAKSVCKDFEIKKLVEYYDLYLQSDTLLLPNVFRNFWNIFIEIYDLGPARFFYGKQPQERPK